MSANAGSCDDHKVPNAADARTFDERPFEESPFELIPFELIPLDERPFTLRPFEVMPFLLMSSCTRGSNAGSPATEPLQLHAPPTRAANVRLTTLKDFICSRLSEGFAID